MMTKVKQNQEIQDMRTSGHILAEVLRFVGKHLSAGMTTKDLSELAAAELARLGGQPAFLGYQGYPDIICISVNEEVVHGIPGKRQIEQGDIVGLDFGVRINGMITDGAITLPVGKPDPRVATLLRSTREALDLGIAQVRDGARVGDISAAIERRLRRDKLGVVEDLIGHGVGHHVHEEPGIPNYGKAGRGPKLYAGMTIAIEPMATLGGAAVVLRPDGWTVATRDGSLSAHFEHTVLVTEDGFEVLTV